MANAAAFGALVGGVTAGAGKAFSLWRLETAQKEPGLDRRCYRRPPKRGERRGQIENAILGNGLVSEAARLARDDPVRELVDLRELLVDQGLRVLLEGADLRPFLGDDLRGGRLRLVDRLPDLRDDPDPDFLHLAGVLLHEPLRDVEREDV